MDPKEDNSQVTSVARGAALVAFPFRPSQGPFDVTKQPDSSLMSTDLDEDEIIVQRITEHSLGVGIQDGRVNKLIEVGTGIPVSRRMPIFMNPGPTDQIDIKVYQGEGEFIHENDLIGVVHLGPLEPKQRVTTDSS